ncbi:signal transduction histidine kinase [Actinokineospora baliensis]|uniref:sensor histidine kinase n=1 Tax=Actinokineospora baliensis TaxID=547056 RepID=UPI00195A41B3|nr:PAS domain-containing sensor histidine kinase [Actinokineospora baliensis]MBM7773359.1 signal transduction histidine kinase [Actinokineospora baliensis]
MADTTAGSPWDCAAAVRAVTWADRSGRAVYAALGLLRGLPGVLDAGVGTEVPDASVTVALTSGGAVSVRCDGEPDPRLEPLVDTVAAALDAARADGGVIDFRDAVIAQMPSIVALFTPDGVLRWSNMVHWPDGTPVRYGETTLSAITSLVHPDDQRRLAGLIENLHTEDRGGQIRHSARVRTPLGWRVLDIDFLDRIDDPVIGGLVAFAHDITALQEAQRETRVAAARLRYLVDSLEVGVLLQDDDRVVLTANTAAATMLDLRRPSAELTGLHAEVVRELRGLPPGHYVAIDELAKRWMREGVPVRGATVQLGPDRVLEVDFVPVQFDQERLGHLWVLRDVTEQVESQRSLQRRNAELSRLASLKTEFIATVSHELRTPLTTLTSLTPLLTDGKGDRTLALAVDRNVHRMATLVETLLFLAGLESHSRHLELAPIRVEPLVAEQIATLTGPATERGVTVVNDRGTDVTVLTGDRDLLARMVHHVVAAAIGSSPPSASVHVRCAVEADDWVLEVTDENPLPGDSGRLFTTMPFGGEGDRLIGSGLGLVLARAIAERHGGAMLLTPAHSGNGTVIRVELPVAGPSS